jgi:hypothetical protein
MKKICEGSKSNRITNHLATIRGDFFGSKSSNTGSRPGYCNRGEIELYIDLNFLKLLKNIE